jgi:hypothetical protein
MNELERHEGANAPKPAGAGNTGAGSVGSTPTTPGAGAPRPAGQTGAAGGSATSDSPGAAASKPAAPSGAGTGSGTSGSGSGGSGSLGNAQAAAKDALGDAGKTARDAASDASESAQETLKSVKDKASSVYDDAAGAAREGYRSVARSAASLRRNAPTSPAQAGELISGYVEKNPILVGVLGLAAGLIIGSLLPGTRRENKVFGRYADEVRDQGLRYARDLAEQGKSMVEENLHAVSQGVRTDRDTGDESRAA